MGKRVRGLFVVTVVGVLGACGSPDVGDLAPGSGAMRRALNCPNCPSPHRIENGDDPSGCGVGETCNPPGAGGTNISCTDGSTSHDGNTCDGVVAAVAN
jgi:hypothetical protein